MYFPLLKRITTLSLLLVFVAVANCFAYNLTVAKDGTGDYTTIQAAVNAVPNNLTSEFTIFIKNGKYVEQVTVASNKPYIKMIGESVANVIIAFGNYNGRAKPGGGTFGTSNSATVIINASNFTAINITFANTTGDAPQAVAVNVNGDKVAFQNCRFLGGQDTLLTNRDGGKQYFRNCYIDGVVDFIFGGATAVFDSCIIYPRTRLDNGGGGYITAANTQAAYPYGYVFRNCKIMNNRGVTTYSLGRPWNNSSGEVNKANNKVVWLNATMASSIIPKGWSVWDSGTDTTIITYAEYKSRKIDGTLVDTTQRVKWSKQLTDQQAAAYYTDTTMLGTWVPCTTLSCAGFIPELAVANVKAKAASGTALVQWNLCWPINGVKCEVYRSNDNINYIKVGEVTSANDTNINFQYTDTLPPVGGTNYYRIKSSKTGFNTTNSDTAQITTASNFNLNSIPFNQFMQNLGTPSASQQYVLSASNVSGTVTVVPPAGYELSKDNGVTWVGSTSSITISVTGTTLPATNMRVRLNAAAAGVVNGSITHTWTGGSYIVNLPVSGIVQSTPSPVAGTLIYYPLAVKAADSAIMRNPAIAADTVTLKNLLVSSGASVPAYSATQGLAFAAAATGSWAATGDSIFNQRYVQFTLAPYYSYAVTADSVVLNTSFLSAATGNKLAVMYSLSGFTADSATITGSALAGTALPATANGQYATPAQPGMEAAATTNHYSFVFGGNSGITIPMGQSLTIRLYYSGNSTATANFAKLKDIYVMGRVLGYLSVPNTAAKQEKLDLYPNPVSSSFTIKHTKTIAGATIYIYQADGKLVKKQTAETNTTETNCDVSALLPGNYFGVMINGAARSSIRFSKL